MISVKDLVFRYPQAQSDALKGVSFDVERGEIFGFLGPSGAGKSTVQRLLNKQLTAAQGELLFDGRPLAETGREYFESIGVAFEQPNLYERLTGEANLVATAGLYTGSSRSPKELFELLDLSPALDQRVATYSKGMKQRLVVLRAIQHQPKILFLDEPTSGNDPANTERMIELIRAERDRGATIVLSTHDMHVADALCDRIAFINEGHIVACDSPRNLKLEHGQEGILVEFITGGEPQSEVIDGSSEVGRKRLDALLVSGTVETLHSREATLGEIFIKLTGCELV